jgi:hypothetical protein
MKDFTAFDPEELQAKLNELNSFRESMPGAKDLKDAIPIALNALKTTVAKESRSVVVDGIPCVALLYEDRVTVVFPAQDCLRKFYDKL